MFLQSLLRTFLVSSFMTQDRVWEKNETDIMEIYQCPFSVNRKLVLSLETSTSNQDGITGTKFIISSKQLQKQTIYMKQEFQEIGHQSTQESDSWGTWDWQGRPYNCLSLFPDSSTKGVPEEAVISPSSGDRAKVQRS